MRLTSAAAPPQGRTDRGDVAGMELGRLLQEGQAGVRVHHVLHTGIDEACVTRCTPEPGGRRQTGPRVGGHTDPRGTLVGGDPERVDTRPRGHRPCAQRDPRQLGRAPGDAAVADLQEGDEVLLHQVVAAGAHEQVHEPGGFVVTVVQDPVVTRTSRLASQPRAHGPQDGASAAP